MARMLFFPGSASYVGRVPVRGLAVPHDGLLENWIACLNLESTVLENNYNPDSITDQVVGGKFRSVSRYCHPDRMANKSSALKLAAQVRWANLQRATELMQTYENTEGNTTYSPAQLQQGYQGTKAVILKRFELWVQRGRPLYEDDVSDGPNTSNAYCSNVKL